MELRRGDASDVVPERGLATISRLIDLPLTPQLAQEMARRPARPPPFARGCSTLPRSVPVRAWGPHVPDPRLGRPAH
eukprot:8282952-Pyramimonas_sp.AAC.1